jgi:hypothetical protein
MIFFGEMSQRTAFLTGVLSRRQFLDEMGNNVESDG